MITVTSTKSCDCTEGTTYTLPVFNGDLSQTIVFALPSIESPVRVTETWNKGFTTTGTTSYTNRDSPLTIVVGVPGTATSESEKQNTESQSSNSATDNDNNGEKDNSSSSGSNTANNNQSDGSNIKDHSSDSSNAGEHGSGRNEGGESDSGNSHNADPNNSAVTVLSIWAESFTSTFTKDEDGSSQRVVIAKPTITVPQSTLGSVYDASSSSIPTADGYQDMGNKISSGFVVLVSTFLMLIGQSTFI